MTASVTPPTRALIVGGDGMLGGALRERAMARDVAVMTTTRRASSSEATVMFLDLADAEAVEALVIPPPPCRVYLLAAVTSLRVCREQPEVSAAINVEAIGRLAERAAAHGATPVLVSTNLVFDGSTPRTAIDEPLSPRTAYGRQKAQAERRVLAAGGVVVRPTKVLGPEPAMLAGWRDALRAGRRVEAFDDLWFSPVPMSAVLDALLDAPPGVHQVSGAEDISYHEAALHVASRVGAAESQVVATSAQQAGIPAEERPRHTTLACEAPHDAGEVLDGVLALCPSR